MNFRFGGGKMTEYGFSSYIFHETCVGVFSERMVWRKKYHKLEEKREGKKFIAMSGK